MFLFLFLSFFVFSGTKVLDVFQLGACLRDPFPLHSSKVQLSIHPFAFAINPTSH